MIAPRLDDPIEHVVLLMLENHSFDQMLGSLASVYPGALDGIPESGPTYSNKDTRGNVVATISTPVRKPRRPTRTRNSRTVSVSGIAAYVSLSIHDARWGRTHSTR